MTRADEAVGTDGVVVVGLGTEYRHDDGVGAVVSSRAAGLGRARDVGPIVDPLDLVGRWDGARLAIVVDAVSSGESPGTIRIMELTAVDPAVAGPTPDGPGALTTSREVARAKDTARSMSSHGIGLVGVLRLGRAIGRAPKRVVVVGVEGHDFSQGVGLSPAVQAAVPAAIREVARLVEEALPCA